MQTQPRFEEKQPMAPMGDDWLTRDPESFGEFDEFDLESEAPARLARWRRVIDDVLLYGAGMTTGLTVVAAAWLVMQLATTPPSASVALPDAKVSVSVEHVARN